MLNSVIRFALRYRMLIVILSLGLIGYGSYLAGQLPIDVFPDLDRPRVVIITECRGLAPADVEKLVTQQIEIALLGANGVQDVRSQSAPELSVIYVEFDWTTDIRSARQTVQERLATLQGVLPDVARPQMAPTASIMGQIVVAGMYRQEGPGGGELAPVPKTYLLAERPSDASAPIRVWEPRDRRQPDTWQPIKLDHFEWLPARRDFNAERRAALTIAGQTHEVVFPSPVEQQMSLRTTADWVVRPRLLKVPGVAEIFILGGERKQYQVLLDPAALLEYGVSLQQVEQALRDNNLDSSGGFATQGEIERPIRVFGRLGPEPHKVIDELRKVPLRTTPERTILLEEVARIVEGPQVKRGDGSVNGRPGVVLTIVKQPHVDTRELTDRIITALEQTEATLSADIVVNTELFRLKNFIDRGIYNVGEALVIGAVLVLIILFLFLLNFRTTFITLTAIPLSLVITTLTFRIIGWLTGTYLSINVMTLGGIAVAMGELVDDAIVDVENIFRRLKENNALPKPRFALRVIYEASVEIRSAIVFGTAVVILVFLPLFALSGVEGRLFAPLGVAYIVSILASLFVSLTVTPVLSYYLLPQAQATHRAGDGPLLRLLKWGATPLIRLSMAWPRLLLALTWALVGLSIWQLTRLGADFLPKFDEGSIQVNVALPPGSSLQASNQVSNILDDHFRKMQKSPDNPEGEILHFVRRTGRAERDEHAEPVNKGEYILSVNPDSGRGRDEILHQLLADLRAAAPGVDIETEQPLSHLISHMLSGVQAQIAVKVFGDDLDKLRQAAEQIQSVIQTVPGVTPPIVEPIQMTEELHIRLRADDLAHYGVSRAYVAGFLQTALQGDPVSQILDGQRRFDLIVRLEEAYRTDYPQLGRLRIDLPPADGRPRGQVELRELADIGPGTGPNAVNHDNALRRIVIRCNTQDRDLASVVADIRQRIGAAVELPPGYFVEYGGQFESQQRATTLIAVLAVVSLVGMFVVLMILFPSAPIALQILNAVPTAFIGGVLALVLTRQTLTVASLVGFISLGGIAVRNGILLVTHYFHLMKYEGEDFSKQMILRGSLERLAPVLMTALTAGIALIPLVLGGNEPGREILYPVATVILGGLTTSTLCEFLIHPGLFWGFSGQDAARLAREDHAEESLTDQST
ncbi:MAG: efflux RND transporter permease subunit [Gemmataceae bacterium]|nr:efflux RND transporter permease subunit [Gemmataceae bacterium]MCI0738741.1 efflux RND transporter permease subunit [Gemmataceae bacterium]